MKSLFIVNPKSGGGRTERTFDETRRVIERRLGAFDVALTERPGHAVVLAEEGVKDGRETIVAVAFGVVAFSILLQGLTMVPLLRKLKEIP